jgi:hypothetical protein
MRVGLLLATFEAMGEVAVGAAGSSGVEARAPDAAGGRGEPRAGHPAVDPAGLAG